MKKLLVVFISDYNTIMIFMCYVVSKCAIVCY